MKGEKVSAKLSGLFLKEGSGEKTKKIIIILGLVGIALIFLSGFLKEREASPVVAEESKMTTEEYTASLQKSLTELISGISGAGEAKVLVTLENSVRFVYATEEKQNSERREEKSGEESVKQQENTDSEIKYITIKDSDGTQHALAVTEIQPTVKGVVVVCPGGDNPMVQQRIICAITTALDISSKRVCVTK